MQTPWSSHTDTVTPPLYCEFSHFMQPASPQETITHHDTPPGAYTRSCTHLDVMKLPHQPAFTLIMPRHGFNDSLVRGKDTWQQAQLHGYTHSHTHMLSCCQCSSLVEKMYTHLTHTHTESGKRDKCRHVSWKDLMRSGRPPCMYSHSMSSYTHPDCQTYIHINIHIACKHQDDKTHINRRIKSLMNEGTHTHTL